MELDQLVEQLRNQQGQLQGLMPALQQTASGVTQWLPWLLGVGAVLLVLRFLPRGIGGVPTLALKEFRLDPSARAGEPILTVVGRRGGIASFLLTKIGLDAVTRLTVSRNEVRCRQAGLSGEWIDLAPLRQIDVVRVGTRKPIGLLFLAAAVLILGLFGRNFLWFVIAGVAAVALVMVYFASRSFVLDFRPGGANRIAVAFKPNVLEGVSVDLEKVLQAAEHIGAAIQAGASARSRSSVQPSPPIDSVFEPAIPLAKDDPVVAAMMPEPAARPAPTGLAGVERVAQMAFRRAALQFQAGGIEEAYSAWERLVRDYPQTRAANQARRNLRRRRTT